MCLFFLGLFFCLFLCLALPFEAQVVPGHPGLNGARYARRRVATLSRQPRACSYARRAPPSSPGTSTPAPVLPLTRGGAAPRANSGTTATAHIGYRPQGKGATAAGQWWSSLKKEGRGSVWPLGIRPNTTLRSFASCAVSDHECPRADGRSALVRRPLKKSCASMNRYTSVAAAAPAGAGHCPAWTSRPAQPRPIERAIGQRHRSTTSVLSLLGRGTGGGG